MWEPFGIVSICNGGILTYWIVNMYLITMLIGCPEGLIAYLERSFGHFWVLFEVALPVDQVKDDDKGD